MNVYDVIIVGAGPAGLSAGIYLARFRRKTLIIDAEKGRSTLPGRYHNLLGFFEPIERRELRKLGAEQAELYGAEKICEQVTDVQKENNVFKVVCEFDTFFAKNIIFCTGVMDNWPQIEGYERYLGYSIHSCPICAGFESINKRLTLIGQDDRVTKLALEMLTYSDKISIVTNGATLNVEEEHLEKVKNANIKVYTNKIVKLIGQECNLRKVILDDGSELETDMIYSRLGLRINSKIAQGIGVSVDYCGRIAVDKEQKTSIDGIYAAGDVTTFGQKQVVTANYEGFISALSIHSKLLKEELEKY